MQNNDALTQIAETFQKNLELVERPEFRHATPETQAVMLTAVDDSAAVSEVSAELSNPPRQRLADVLMNEHIRMPGFPQLVVTRAFAHDWLKKHKFDTRYIDYVTFSTKSVADPLTTAKTRNRWLREMAKEYKRNPDKFNGYKRNPESSAASLSETFHGRPAESVTTFTTDVHTHEWLAELGLLVSLTVETESGYCVDLDFDYDTPKNAVHMGCSEDGKQIYFESGDQSLDLSAMKMSGRKWERDHMVIGRVAAYAYYTSKVQDGNEPTIYTHKAGEDLVDGKHRIVTDIMPTLVYDTINKLISFAGGQYYISDEAGIRS